MEAARVHEDSQWWDRPEWYRALSLAERDGTAPVASSARAATGWLAALREAFGQADATSQLDCVPGGAGAGHPLAGCLLALAPLLQRGLAAVEATMQSLRRQGRPVPVSAEVIRKAFVANIAPTLLFQISKPFVLELQIARLQGHLHGQTPQERFEYFVRKLSGDRLVVQFLAKYPVLARQLVETIDQWAAYQAEFLTHLSADWETLIAAFATDGEPGLLTELDAGKGDRHRHGRSVLALRFSSGLRLLYKPKPLAADAHFQELLRWLNRFGADPALRPLRVLDRGCYGWSEFAAASSCESEEEVRRFYQRQGSYLALLYTLAATDLHNENLVAAGEHPVLVDLEALFHPRVHGTDPALASMAAGALDSSVWQVGLLPHRIWSDGESPGVDMSGLGGQPGQPNPHQLLAWEKPGTDEMRLGRRRAELPVSENRPRLRGHAVDVLNYRDAVVTGFTRMYRLLCRHKDRLLAEQLPRFAHDEIRTFARPTNVYGLLWYESFHPDLLRDALDRDRFFDRLWLEAKRRPYLGKVIPAERRDLWRGDIPVFTTTPGSLDMLTSDGEPVAGFFDMPSLELVRRRVEQLDEDDCARQTWIIEASLATLRMDSDTAMGIPLRVSPAARAAGRERLLRLASEAGQRLSDLALHNETGASWLGVGPLDESTWALFPSGTDLYSGTTGIALFLAYLGAVTGEPAPRLLARRAVASLRAELRESPPVPEGEEPGTASFPTAGAFVGLPSVIYLLAHLGVLWHDPGLLDEATGLVKQLPPLISADTYHDILQGSAGCIMALLSLYSVRPSRAVLEAAIGCGDHLLASAQPMPRGIGWTALKGEPPLGGLSHGAAGIALSLLQLAGRSGEERFRRSALGALRYDRSLFVPELGNWADLRAFVSRKRAPDRGGQSPAGPDAAVTVAWCHGAPGIGLARLGGLNQLDGARVRREIDVALRATTRHGFAMNHSLCHGALGNAELLLTAARLLARREDHEALARAAAQIAGSIEANGFVTGVPLGVETPGFMTGLAGIGFGLLRLAEPDKVPAALLLAPPRWRTPG